MDPFAPMISREEAFGIMDRTLASKRLEVEEVDTNSALGRILASDHTSRLQLPPFDKSAMDGYAVRADDRRDKYRVVATVAAGEARDQAIQAGTAVKIMTGAAVPPGGGRVIKVEDTEQDGDDIRIIRHGSNTNIALQGEDVRPGDIVLPSGTHLGALELANLVACGITRAEVFKKARIAVLSTGNEIVDSPEEIGPGKIMNSNGPMLVALAREFGIEPVRQAKVDDDMSSTVECLRRSMEESDITLLSGGVSVGDFDFVIEAMEKLGLELHFTRLAVLPGKPTVFASRGDKLVFGLPGNPVSVFLAFHYHVLRAVGLLCGTKFGLREIPMRLDADYTRRKTVRLQHVPCVVNDDGGVEPVEYHGSAHLRALLRADGFFLVPIGTAEFKSGTRVSFLPFPRGFA